jgi:hypothetical protein
MCRRPEFCATPNVFRRALTPLDTCGRRCSGNFANCRSISESLGTPDASSAFKAYNSAPMLWSAACAVATACPAARAAAIAALPLASLAAACAANEAFMASPVLTVPSAQLRRMLIAYCGRGSLDRLANIGNTRSAQSAAHRARTKWSARTKGPPRCAAMNRRSLMGVTQPRRTPR